MFGGRSGPGLLVLTGSLCPNTRGKQICTEVEGGSTAHLLGFFPAIASNLLRYQQLNSCESRLVGQRPRAVRWLHVLKTHLVLGTSRTVSHLIFRTTSEGYFTVKESRAHRVQVDLPGLPSQWDPGPCLMRSHPPPTAPCFLLRTMLRSSPFSSFFLKGTQDEKPNGVTGAGHCCVPPIFYVLH